MGIRWKRRTLLAFCLTFSSGCLVLWIILFITSPEQSFPVDGHIDRTARDRVVVAKLSRNEQNMHADYRGKDSNEAESLKPTNDEKFEKDPDPVLIPDNPMLRNLTWAELSLLYHRYLSRPQTSCSNTERIGRVTDGGWDVCVEGKYAPKQSSIVYSFGVGDDFSFEDALIHKFGCKVYSFDPSMAMGNTQRSAKSFFYKMGVADSDRTLPNGWPMSRFESIRAVLKHSKVPLSIVKFDIEEWEWEVLPDLLTSDQLKNVDQLLIELHQCEGCSNYNPNQEDKEPGHDRYIHMLELLRQLYQQNFRIFHLHDNSACKYLDKFTNVQRSACVEVGFIHVS